MTRKVRVLWLVKGLGRGGAEQLLVALAREMDYSTVSVEVAYLLPHKDALVDSLREAGAQVHCLADRAGAWPVTLRRLLRAQPFDIVHSHSPVLGAAARIIAPRQTVFLHTEHNVWPRYRLATRMANALTIGRNHLVWAVSDSVAKSIRVVGPTRDRPDVRVLLHGVSEPSVHLDVHTRAAALQRLRLDPGPFTVGSVGNLTAKKDQDILIEAVGRLRDSIPDARLVLIGGGPREEHLRRLVGDRRLGDAVILTGVRDDVPQLLPAFDAFAMSSRYEGLSIAMLEAMAIGLPPVVTDVGGIPEVVTHGVDGLLVEPQDPGALADALHLVATDPDLRARLGTAARERARSFGIEPAARTVLRTYVDLAVGRPLVA